MGSPPPTGGWCLIWCSWFLGSTHAATGVVARISDGEFVLAAARGYDNIQNLLTAETLDFRDAITEAVKEGWQHVHFETACQIGSGEAKENASNLVPLKGDWRDRVERTKAKAKTESMHVADEHHNPL